MKKCLHLKRTKRHWRRKPPKVITWRDRLDAERERLARARNVGMAEMAASMVRAAVGLAALTGAEAALDPGETLDLEGFR